MTPEGKVKVDVKKVLEVFKPWLYYEMPVPGGFGKSGLDFHCIFCGHALVIETKAPGKDLTQRQIDRAKEIYESGGTVFIISSKAGTLALLKWFAARKNWINANPDYDGAVRAVAG